MQPNNLMGQIADYCRRAVADGFIESRTAEATVEVLPH